MAMTLLYIILGGLTTFTVVSLLLSFTLFKKLDKQSEVIQRADIHWTDLNFLLTSLNNTRLDDQRGVQTLKEQWLKESTDYRQQWDQHQLQSFKLLQDSLQQGMGIIGERVEKLTAVADQKLQDISSQVEKRLADGFSQTTATFTDVVKRLALIDEAQKKITELSHNVLTLQQLLGDKRSRGAFGEVQLNALVQNLLPATHFKLQYTLTNGKRADCVIFLPEPTGTIAIDAKFPLENFRKLTDLQISASEKRSAEIQFRQDIRQHIQDVAQKYILPPETAEGAILFIPAEAVFAEIHSHYYELVEEAHKRRVWLVSPTTLMAILTTARAVLKDAATREQVHLIQKYLNELSKDFARFQQRMENLSRHIQHAHTDLQEVKTSATKITDRFEKIEKVEFEGLEK